jgi:hypothetical protein
MESSSGGRGDASSRSFITASRWFALVGWVLIGSTLSSLIFGSLPVRLVDPEWQLRLISGILGSSPIFLIGTLLVCGAQLLNTRSQKLLQRAQFLRLASGWLAVLLLVLIPFQFYAGHRASGVVQASENEGIQLVKRIIKGVKASNNEPELRSFLASLPSPPPVPAKFEAPFAEIKQRLLTNFEGRLNALNYQAGLLRSQRLEKFIADATRNSVQALLMAIAFTGIAAESGPLFGLFQKVGLYRYRD